MRRVLAFGFVAALSLQCGSIEGDAPATAAELAGPGAIDCGLADGNAFDEPTAAADVRACMRGALERKQPFFASVSPASADGGTVIAFASDGRALWQVEHDYVIAIMVGCDSESIDERACERFTDYGDDCSSLWLDLCFACEPVTGDPSGA